MLFLSPIWLLALLPWGGLAAWSLVRRGRTVPVPFVDLWRSGPAVAPRRRGARVPPVAVLLFLTSVLLTILAAAGPVLRGGGVVAVIVDRGVTTSAGGRYRAATDAAIAELSRRGLMARVVAVPGIPQEVTRGDQIPPTAVDTRSLLPGAILEATRFDRPAVVVTDQDVAGLDGPRVSRVAPAAPPGRAVVTLVAARAGPVGQLLVRIRSECDAPAAELTVTTNGRPRPTRIDLPPRGQTRDYFIDLDETGETVDVSAGPELAEHAYLVRQSLRRRVEARGPVPLAVERVIGAYGRARPAAANAPRVVVTSDLPIATDAPTIVVTAGQRSRLPPPPVELVDDPLTRDLDWHALLRSATVAGRPPEGWRPLVTVGGVVVFAVPPEPQRAAWVGFEPAVDAQSVAWIIFWTRLLERFDGGGAGEFVASPPEALGEGWRLAAGALPAGTPPGLWPGAYRNIDGRLRAVNAPDVRASNVASTPDWSAQVAVAHGAGRGRRLGPPILVLALFGLCGAVLTAARSARRSRSS